MTDRELIALMAAAIKPHMKFSQFSAPLNEAAVNSARDLLAEVDRQLASPQAAEPAPK